MKRSRFIIADKLTTVKYITVCGDFNVIAKCRKSLEVSENAL